MVTERLPGSASQQDLDSADSGLEFEIADSTSTEQREQEHRLLSEDPVDGVEQSEDQVRPGQPAGKVPPEPQTAGDQPDQAHPATEQAQRNGRTYSQDEVSKMQAAWARQIQEARRSAERADQQLKQFNLDAAVEATLRQQEKQLAGRMSPEQARQAAHSPQNTQMVRQTLATQHALVMAEAGRRYAAGQQEKQAKFIVARTLAQQHGVPTDDFEVLSSAPTPSAMVQLARRLGGRSGDAMRSRVPAETSQTTLENGYYAGPSPENSSRRLDRIRSKPSWEWTDADLRFMRTGEVR